MSQGQKTSEFIKNTTTRLQDAGVPTARLDCIVLLEDELNRERAWILANPEYEIPAQSIERLSAKILKRVAHIPIAYIRSKVEFYGREFTVNAHTLVPRPETETMIGVLKGLALSSGAHFLDVGTGSGCIAITAKLEIPSLEVSACDIDIHCLDIAKENARRLYASINFMQSDLLEKVGAFDIIGANLPYVPDDFQINTAATHEPHQAIYGGLDGLDYYRTLFLQIKDGPTKPLYTLTESLPFQHDELTAIAKAAGFSLTGTDDFIQLFK